MNRILPIILVIIAIGLFIGYVHPTYTKSIDALSTEIKGYDDVLLSAKQFKEKQSQLSSQKSSIAPDQLARLEAFLPDSVDNVQLILDLNALASRSGVQLSNLDVSLPDASAPAASVNGALALQQESPVESLEVSVSAFGTYSAFRAFLAGIENSLRPLDIVDLSIKDSSVASVGSAFHSYDITFRIYWLR